MILDVEHWSEGYRQILADCRAAAGLGVLVLCHADVDALAAARIVTYLLRADNVPYALRPCPTYGALRRAVTTGSYAAILLLNVGGTRNLTKLFGDGGLDYRATKVYVMDGRRPLHLANLHAADHVLVFWDPAWCHQYDMTLDDIPSDGDNLSGNDEDDDDDDDSSSSSSSSDGTSENELVDSEDEEEGETEMEFDRNNTTTGEDRTKVPTKEEDHTNQDEVDMDYDGEDEGPEHATPRKLKKKTKSRDKTATTTTTTTAGSPNTQATDATQDLEDDDVDVTVDMTMTDDTLPMTGATTTANSTQDTNNTQHLDTSVTIPIVPLTPAQRHAQRLERIKLYYSHGHSYGSPCSFVAYRLASQMRFGRQPDLLWLGMIGVTDAYLQARLDVMGYASFASALQDDCRKLFPTNSHDTMEERIHDTVHAEELTVHHHGNDDNNQNKTRLTFSQQGRIVPQTDLRLCLLRHASLWDALSLSNYVSTRLQLWTKPGMQRLQELLARMGYPLDECRQPYHFMKPSLRRQLYSKMGDHAPEFGLDELEFTSFVRVTGYSSLTSASDICYAASALLECPQVSGSAAYKKGQSTHSDDDDHVLQLEEWDLDCFHAAYDALGNQTASSNTVAMASSGTRTTKSSTSANLQLGIQWAKKLQSLIISTAVSLVTRNAITRLRHFRYAYITCTATNTGAAGVGGSGGAEPNHMRQGNPQDVEGRNGSSSSSHNLEEQFHVLAKPLALTRLAHYLMDMHRANGKWVGEKQTRPLVLLAEQPATGTYLVVGYEMAEKAGHLPANKFGQYFGYAASSFGGGTNNKKNTTNNENNDGEEVEHAKAVARLESFDAHVVEVASSHVQHFLEQLHYIMDSM